MNEEVERVGGREAGEGGEPKAAAKREAEAEDAGAEAKAEDAGAEAKTDKKPGRIQQLVQEFGIIALLVFLSISAVTYTGFVVAISAGFEADGAGEEAGVWFAAWVALQATKPIRIPLTVVLTPIVAALWHRVRGKPLPRKD